MLQNRLLIIDDEAEIRTLLTRIAERCGYEVRSTGCAGQFRALSRAWAPSHILLDLQMPGIDGIELICSLADHGSRASILVMSGLDQRTLDSARRLGILRGLSMAGTLRKPMRAAEIEALLLGVRLGDQPRCDGGLS